jgi:hypothetical protein
MFGSLLTMLETEAGALRVLTSLNDAALLAEIEEMGAEHDENPGEYAVNAARRFSAIASADDWLALRTALERAADPALTALERMLRWSILKDREPAAGGCGALGCMGGHVHGHDSH